MHSYKTRDYVDTQVLKLGSASHRRYWHHSAVVFRCCGRGVVVDPGDVGHFLLHTIAFQLLKGHEPTLSHIQDTPVSKCLAHNAT